MQKNIIKICIVIFIVIFSIVLINIIIKCNNYNYSENLKEGYGDRTIDIPIVKNEVDKLQQKYMPDIDKTTNTTISYGKNITFGSLNKSLGPTLNRDMILLNRNKDGTLYEEGKFIHNQLSDSDLPNYSNVITGDLTRNFNDQKFLFQFSEIDSDPNNFKKIPIELKTRDCNNWFRHSNVLNKSSNNVGKINIEEDIDTIEGALDKCSSREDCIMVSEYQTWKKIENDKYRYEIINEYKSFFEHRLAALLKNGDLLSIENRDEYLKISELRKPNPNNMRWVKAHFIGGIRIGINYQDPGNDDEWKWTDGTPWRRVDDENNEIIPWDGNEPNNWGPSPREHKNEHFAHFWGNNNKINDVRNRAMGAIYKIKNEKMITEYYINPNSMTLDQHLKYLDPKPKNSINNGETNRWNMASIVSENENKKILDIIATNNIAYPNRQIENLMIGARYKNRKWEWINGNTWNFENFVEDNDIASRIINPPEWHRSYSSIWGHRGRGDRHARSMIDSHQAWTPLTGATNHYMTIDLGAERNVIGVVTQGRRNESQWVTEFTVSVNNNRNDNNNPHPFTEGNRDRSSRVTNYFPEGPRKGRFVRISPTNWHHRASMRAAVIVQTYDIIDPPENQRSYSSHRSEIPRSSRLNSDTGWIPREPYANEHMTINLDFQRKITGIVVRGHGWQQQLSRRFRVTISNDIFATQTVVRSSRNMTGQSYVNSASNNTNANYFYFDNPVYARSLRITITNPFNMGWRRGGFPAMRVGLLVSNNYVFGPPLVVSENGWRTLPVDYENKAPALYKKSYINPNYNNKKNVKKYELWNNQIPGNTFTENKNLFSTENDDIYRVFQKICPNNPQDISNAGFTENIPIILTNNIDIIDNNNISTTPLTPTVNFQNMAINNPDRLRGIIKIYLDHINFNEQVSSIHDFNIDYLYNFIIGEIKKYGLPHNDKINIPTSKIPTVLHTHREEFISRFGVGIHALILRYFERYLADKVDIIINMQNM